MLHLDDARPRRALRRSPRGPGAPRCDVVGTLLLGVEQLEDPLGARGPGLHGRGHAAELAQGLGELLGVLDEGLHIAQAQRPGGDHGAADHRDGHIVDVPDDQHDRHHDPGEELGAQRGPEELLVLGGEGLAHRGRAPVDLHQGVPGEGLLHPGVDLAGARPLVGEGLLRARPDHPEDHAHEREHDERHQRQLPGDGEHHPQHAHHREDRGQGAGQGLLEGVGDVVDVVGQATEQLTALDGVEVAQRQAVDLVLHLGAQPVEGLDRDAVDEPALKPVEQARPHVQAQHHCQDPAQAGVVDTRAGDDVHRREHGGEVVHPPRSQGLNGLGLGGAGRQHRGDHALEDDVGGLTQHLGGRHRQHHRAHRGQGHDHQGDPVGAQQPDHPLEGGPEGLGLARRRPVVPVARGGLRLSGQLEVLLAELIGGDDGARGALAGVLASVPAHAAASAPSWEVTISR